MPKHATAIPPGIPSRRHWLHAGLAAAGVACVPWVRAQAPAPTAPATADDTAKPKPRNDSVPSSWVAAVPALAGAQVVGQGRLSFFGLQVYDARLWVLPGFDASRFDGHPFALELRYLRTLKGRLIAERSLKEMRALPGFDDRYAADWLSQMTALFPDVQSGDTLAGIHAPGEGARFDLNGTPRGHVPTALFARLFFGIWLSPQTSEPALRQALLGGRP
jgi:Chalcone isomerase-like